MTEELDAVLLDLGGTLIDTRPTKEDVFFEVLSRHGPVPGGLSAVTDAVRRAERMLDDDFASLEGKDEQEFWLRYDRIVLENLGFKEDAEGVCDDLTARFRDVIPRPESWVAYPDAEPFLDALDKRDFKKGVVSNATELAREVMDRLDLTRHFDFIILSDEVNVRKPSPEIFRMAAKEAGTVPARAVYLGDKLAVDIRGAESVGMRAILVDRADVYPDADCFRIRNLDHMRRYF